MAMSSDDGDNGGNSDGCSDDNNNDGGCGNNNGGDGYDEDGGIAKWSYRSLMLTTNHPMRGK